MPDNVFIFALVLCRSSAAIMLLPGIGEDAVPTSVRAGFAFALAVLLTPVEMRHFTAAGPTWSASPVAMAGLIGAELAGGGLIGLIARLMCLSLPIAAQIIATFVGLASVLQPDPQMGAQSTALSRMASLLVPVLVLETGLYQLPLHALCDSYSVFPVGQVPLVGDLAHSVTLASSRTFGIAAELAGPFIVVGTLWQVMLAMLSRFVPSLQVYGLAMPAQLLGGLLLVALLGRTLLGAWQADMAHVLHDLPGL
nr:flagellar biosynthetic protein FliR [Ameyamaea chiangmaiensis]